VEAVLHAGVYRTCDVELCWMAAFLQQTFCYADPQEASITFNPRAVAHNPAQAKGACHPAMPYVQAAWPAQQPSTTPGHVNFDVAVPVAPVRVCLSACNHNASHSLAQSVPASARGRSHPPSPTFDPTSLGHQQVGCSNAGCSHCDGALLQLFVRCILILLCCQRYRVASEYRVICRISICS
jgi:hypothetical protein